jgi:hypothetical protein
MKVIEIGLEENRLLSYGLTLIRKHQAAEPTEVALVDPMNGSHYSLD